MPADRKPTDRKPTDREPRRRLSSRALLALAGGAAIAVVLGLGSLLAIRMESPGELDAEWLEEVVENRGPWFELPARLLDFVGGGWFAIVVVPVGVAALFLLARRPWSALVFVTGSAASALAVAGLKPLFGRVRPEDGLIMLDSAAFPSGHTANAAVVAVLLALLVRRWWVGLLGAAWVVAMALSRTYLAVHWLTDTIAGALFGAGMAVLVWSLFASLLRSERMRATAGADGTAADGDLGPGESEAGESRADGLEAGGLESDGSARGA